MQGRGSSTEFAERRFGRVRRDDTCAADTTVLERTEGMTLRLTPGMSFAAAALVVSALSLAFAIGRHYPLSTTIKTNAAPGIEAVYQQPPIPYSMLEVDRGRID